MNLPTTGSERNSRVLSDRWSPVDRVMEHLEYGADAVSEFPEQVRDVAEEQTPAFVEETLAMIPDQLGISIATTHCKGWQSTAKCHQTSSDWG